MRAKGKITSWNDKKGYGFIKPFGGGKRVFLHISALPSRNRRPGINEVVTYTLSSDSKGRPRAKKANLSGDRQPKDTRRFSKYLAVTLAATFLLCVVIAVFTSKIPSVVLVIYLAVSLTTYIAYNLDKSAARNGNWRIPESTLHILSLFGGWPGALVAQQKLRHKSKKQPFRVVFWLTVIVNCGVLLFLITPGGVTISRKLLNLAIP
jgi:uncharacterized membrane protein YsdA (DUF1294 family)/cold shock CspA family protein